MITRRERLALLSAAALGASGGVAGFSPPSAAMVTPPHRRPVFARTSISITSTTKNQMQSSCLFASSLCAASPESTEPSQKESLRARMRRLTGFSLTALRATARAATGISLTALYASTVAVSGAWIRQTMKVLLGIFPAWLRYFAQPFLVLYYVPLFLLRNLSSPNTRQGGSQAAKSKHEAFVESWMQAVETADEKSSYWPLHVREGHFEADLSELDVNEAVAESVEVALEDGSTSTTAATTESEIKN